MATFPALVEVLETDPERFNSVAHRTNDLPGAPRVRDYTEDEITQLTRGVLNMLLESLRGEEPRQRQMFLEFAVPSFVNEGETVASMVRWNSTYFVLLGATLVRFVPDDSQTAFYDWFGDFVGRHVADVADAAERAVKELLPDAQ